MNYVTVEIIKEFPEKPRWRVGQSVTVLKEFAFELLKKKVVKLKTTSAVVEPAKPKAKDEEE